MNWEPSARFDEWGGCRACAHWRVGRCVAFPKGIPLMIVGGEVDHMVPRPGQVGDTVFTPVDWDILLATGERMPARQEPAPQPTG